MKDLKGTKTEANLMAAFAGESQARNKYTYYASKAKKEGYEQIAALFLETANNEKEHAKISAIIDQYRGGRSEFVKVETSNNMPTAAGYHQVQVDFQRL